MNTQYHHFKTSQSGPHHQLSDLVERYKITENKRPIPQHQQIAFLQIKKLVTAKSLPIIIDSGCGTGLSSITLAEQFFDHWVVGIDKSSHRLKKTANLPPNCLLIRGDVFDLWRLLKISSLPIVRHYLLYPNPWPKIGHIKRRFYASNIWPTCISLAPYFELRCNWRIYAEEAVIALKLLGQKPIITNKTNNNYLSLFEKKYIENGCELFIIKNDLIT